MVAPTVIFCCGAECDLSHWTGRTTSYCTANSTYKITGSYGLRCVTANQTGYAYVAYDDGTKTTVVISAQLLIHAEQASATIFNPMMGDGGFILRANANGHLELGPEGGSYTQSADVVSLDAFHLIEIKVNAAANPNLADWRIDEVAQTQVSYAHAATTQWGLGFSSTAGNTGHDIVLEDLAVSLTAGDWPLGAGTVSGSPEVWTPAAPSYTYLDPMGAMKFFGI